MCEAWTKPRVCITNVDKIMPRIPMPQTQDITKPSPPKGPEGWQRSPLNVDSVHSTYE